MLRRLRRDAECTIGYEMSEDEAARYGYPCGPPADPADPAEVRALCAALERVERYCRDMVRIGSPDACRVAGAALSMIQVELEGDDEKAQKG
jgi:hypothetical protein